MSIFALDYRGLDAWWWPFVFILIAGWLANDMWRILGVVFAGRLKEDSVVFTYVRAVATALVAGVIAQLIFLPTGSLGQSPLWLRLAAVAAGFAAFKVARDSVLIGVLVGEAVMVVLWIAVVGLPN